MACARFLEAAEIVEQNGSERLRWEDAMNYPPVVDFAHATLELLIQVDKVKRQSIAWSAKPEGIGLS